MAPMREGDWICPGCENHNFASRQACNKCQAPRSDGGYGAAPSKGGGKGKSFSPYAPPAANYGGAPAQPAGGKELKEGDWMCPGCGNHNFASRVNCNRCGEIKQGMKNGDWICRSCKNHNFASRTACNKCQVPRPHDAESAVAGKGGGKGYSAPPAAAAYGAYGSGKGGYDMYGGKGGYDMYGKGGYDMYGGYGKGGYGGGMVPVYMDPYKGGGKGMMYAAPMAPYGMMQQAPMQSTKPMKEGDWMCPSCGNHNFASRVACNKCQVIRQGMKEGDWICKGCKNHNFASRQECNKCKNPRTA